MPLSVSAIQLKLVTFSPENSISSDPRKMHTETITIRNDEPEDVLVKWESNSPNKLKVQPSAAVISSRSEMFFDIAIHALNLRHDSPRLRFCCKVVGLRECEDERYPAKDIWESAEYWEELVTTLVHRKYIFIEFKGMLKPGWWKKGKDGKDRALWAAEINDDGDDAENEDLFE